MEGRPSGRPRPAPSGRGGAGGQGPAPAELKAGEILCPPCGGGACVSLDQPWALAGQQPGVHPVCRWPGATQEGQGGAEGGRGAGAEGRLSPEKFAGGTGEHGAARAWGGGIRGCGGGALIGSRPDLAGEPECSNEGVVWPPWGCLYERGLASGSLFVTTDTLISGCYSGPLTGAQASSGCVGPSPSEASDPFSASGRVCVFGRPMPASENVTVRP